MGTVSSPVSGCGCKARFGRVPRMVTLTSWRGRPALASRRHLAADRKQIMQGQDALATERFAQRLQLLLPGGAILLKANGSREYGKNLHAVEGGRVYHVADSEQGIDPFHHAERTLSIGADSVD